MQGVAHGRLGFAQATGQRVDHAGQGVDSHRSLGQVGRLLGQVNGRQLVETHQVVGHHHGGWSRGQLLLDGGHFPGHGLDLFTVLRRQVLQGGILQGGVNWRILRGLGGLDGMFPTGGPETAHGGSSPGRRAPLRERDTRRAGGWCRNDAGPVAYGPQLKGKWGSPHPARVQRVRVFFSSDPRRLRHTAVGRRGRFGGCRLSGARRFRVSGPFPGRGAEGAVPMFNHEERACVTHRSDDR